MTASATVEARADKMMWFGVVTFDENLVKYHGPGGSLKYRSAGDFRENIANDLDIVEFELRDSRRSGDGISSAWLYAR